MRHRGHGKLYRSVTADRIEASVNDKGAFNIQRQAQIRTTHGHNAICAWREGVKGFDGVYVKQTLLQPADLLPSFTSHYQKLTALIRHMRRRLQRER